MLNDLNIKGSVGLYFTPTVNLSAETGHCIISGESYLEETFEFYNKVIEWIEQYTQNPEKPIVFDFKLRYINSTSSKGILLVLNALRKAKDNGSTITINWYVAYDDEEEEDDDMVEEIEDYVKDTGLKIAINYIHER